PLSRPDLRAKFKNVYPANLQKRYIQKTRCRPPMGVLIHTIPPLPGTTNGLKYTHPFFIKN
ncbi:hypothetical protein ACVGW3_12530, partial [Enterobacter hormaechei]